MAIMWRETKKEPSFTTSFLYCLWFKAVGGRAVLLNLFDDVRISRGKTCLAVHLKWNRKVNVLLQNFNSLKKNIVIYLQPETPLRISVVSAGVHGCSYEEAWPVTLAFLNSISRLWSWRTCWVLSKQPVTLERIKHPSADCSVVECTLGVGSF